MKTLNWGIIGTGAIARTFARALGESTTGQLLAVGSRNQETAEAFARDYGAARSYAGYESLLADSQVQVVYIATPHPMHVKWAMRCAEAGKHILVEKPIGMNRAEVQAAIEAAAAHDVFLMEAFMYRCHPQTRRLVELISHKAIGQVRLLYTYEANEVARCIDQRQSPAMSWEDSLGNMEALDKWRAEIGLAYNADQ